MKLHPISSLSARLVNGFGVQGYGLSVWRLSWGHPISHWLEFMLDPRNLPDVQRHHWREIILYIAVVLDSIWFTRNSVVHQHVVVQLDQLMAIIRHRYDEQILAWASAFGHPLSVWKPPDPLCFKIKFDISTLNNKLVFAVVCRDSKGAIVKAHVGWRLGSNPLKGETLAARLAET